MKTFYTDESLYQTLTRVALKPGIEKFDNGFDTMVEEDGALLSGGQKQRLTIAQALFRNSSILIFDESTTNLGADNESIIVQLIS